MSLLLLSIDEEQLAAEQIAAIKQNIPDDMSFVQTRDEVTIKQLAREIEIFAGYFDPDWLLEMPRLRWVQSWGAGVNWLMHSPPLREAPFILTNAVGVHAVPISEHVFALILAFGRKIPNALAAQDRVVWARIKHPTEAQETPFAFSWDNLVELANQTILVMGVGAIGERVAKLAQAFDMRVIGMRRNPEKASPYVDEMIGPDQLLESFSKSDFIVNTLPLTSETKQLLGTDEFAAMKTSAFLVNIGRGWTVDERALIRALGNSTIAGAGLDVFEEEPLPDNSPLWAMSNVMITSHYAGATSRYHERALAIFLDNLKRFQNGYQLRNVVDKRQGY